MLYSLEYVKSTKQPNTSVLFCHVPPLDSRIWDDKITPEYVQQFVQEMLETWHTIYQEEAPADGAKPNGETKKDPRARDTKEIKEFIGRYFRTWSEQDMKGYDACFLPDASIQHIGSRGRLSTYSRPDFIESQREYHRTSPHKTTEVAETVDIRFEERLARVVVYWKLTAGPRTSRGYDHFTLMRHEGSWRIVNLVFYGDE
jgi:hypothetical protein